MAALLSILIIGNAGYIGGFNGITDLRTLKGWDIRTDDAKFYIYFATVVCLLLVILFYSVLSLFGNFVWVFVCLFAVFLDNTLMMVCVCVCVLG